MISKEDSNLYDAESLIDMAESLPRSRGWYVYCMKRNDEYMDIVRQYPIKNKNIKNIANNLLENWNQIYSEYSHSISVANSERHLIVCNVPVFVGDKSFVKDVIRDIISADTK